jgi:hypothetical protein
MSIKSLSVCGLLLVAATLSGCSRETAASAQSAAPGTSATAGAAADASTTPGALPPMATSRSTPAEMTPAGGDEAHARSVTGKVVETMDAASYTYLKVETAGESIWAATSKMPLAVGDVVTVALESPMQNFHSAALNRDFPVIYFTTSVGTGTQPAAQGMPPGHPAVGAGAKAVEVQKLPPPEGGSSIADVWANRKSLGGKTVTVRGTVVKFNGGIMGKNWLHVQDGSGSAEAKTHDLTVTTDAVAKVGDVVTVTGTLTLDKDFGAGYTYAAIVENATVRAK